MIDFSTLFKYATGLEPFPYQERLANVPESSILLNVPTGLGKTDAVVMAWVYRRRYAPHAVREATPRRLVYCLPMRSLVEQTHDKVQRLLKNLSTYEENHVKDSVRCIVLMGGDIDNSWDENPEDDTIIIGTQDQLLSRALNRGYAMSRYRWPIHFALLNNDVMWVFDEVQLLGSAVPTSAQLAGFRKQFGHYGHEQSIWMSATMNPTWLRTPDFNPDEATYIELDSDDKMVPVIQQRLAATKPISKASVLLIKDTTKYAKALAKEIVNMHQPKTLSLVVLNRVSRVQAVANILQSTTSSEIVVVHSRFRAGDRKRIQQQMSSDIPPQGRIIIATQAIEAGLDISARLLISELAPWASMVQRFGRLNRYGKDDLSEGVWIDTDLDGASAEELSRPYEIGDLKDSRERLISLRDASPASLPKVQFPQGIQPIIRRKDMIELFDTSADLSGADIDISPFVRNVRDTDLSVFWRDIDNPENVSGKGLPQSDEICPVAISQMRRFLEPPKNSDRSETRHAWIWNPLESQWEPLSIQSIRPGLVVMLNSSEGGYTPLMGFSTDYDKKVDEVLHPSSPPNESMLSDNSSCEAGTYVELERHLLDTANEVQRLAADLPKGWPVADVTMAARLHDVGKAHGVFQQWLKDGQPDVGLEYLWAKSPGRPRTRKTVLYFRHELASALAILEWGYSDLVAYLAAAHHGKVRLSIRSLPNEQRNNLHERIARGIQDGDVVPRIKIGNDIFPDTILSLTMMDIGQTESGPSWIERTTRLRHQYGPFQLAWMETIVRIADWRASRKEATNSWYIPSN